MRIFAKFLSRCMIEKKSRLFLLVFSIAISTMLLVSSIGVLKVILNSYSSAYTIGHEGAEIVISSKNNMFFKEDDINFLGVKDSVGEIDYTGIMSHENEDNEMVYVTLRGKKLNQVEKNYNNKIISGNINDLEDKTCIISQRISEEHNLELGDYLKILISREEVELKIVGICGNTGAFYMDTSSKYSVIVNYTYMQEFFDVEDVYNVIFAKTSEDTINEGIDLFQSVEDNKNFDANPLYDDEALSVEYAAFFISMYAMLGFVMIMCFVIIYGAFNLVLNERLPEIGTFLSQGATKRKVKNLLYLESVCYGFLGGLFGNLAGVVVLYIINRKISPLAEYGIIEKFSIDIIYLIIGLVFAMVLSFFAAALPIRKINRLSVKDIILNNFYVPVKTGWAGFFIGIGMIAIAMVGAISNGKWTVDFSYITSVFVIVGIVLLASKLIDLITRKICGLVKERSSILFLAFNNIRTSRVLMANIILIIITLFSSISINAVSKSIIDTINSAYYNLEYNIAINNILPNTDDKSTTDSILEKIENQDFIIKESINPFYKINGHVDQVNTYTIAAYPDRFQKYMAYLQLDTGENKKVFDEFTKEKSPQLVVTEKLLDKLDKKVGDTVTIKINDIENDFKIIGAIDGKMYFSGLFAFIHYDHMKESYGLEETSTITFQVTTEDDKAKIEIDKLIYEYGATSITKTEEVASQISATETLCQSLILFSNLIIIIAVLGVVNNMLVGLFQRKRELALLSSVGMSNNTRNRMLMTESVLTVFWAIVIVVPYSFLVVKIISKFMKWIGMPVDVKLYPNSVMLTILITVIGIILATIPIFIKSRKISIIDEMRYE